MPADQPHMSTGPAADYLGVSRRTLSRWISSGRIPATVLPSGRYRLLREDLDAALAKRTLPEQDAA